MVEAPANEFPLQSGNSGGKKDMRSVKRGGKFFYCGKYCFGKYVHWHIPKEQKASFFEPSKCTIASELLFSISVNLMHVH